MKRLITLLLAVVLLLGLFGCSSSSKNVVARFTEGMKKYDRTVMTECLTEFPNNEGYVYLDDIFNDAKYVELYQLLFDDISYVIKKKKRNSVIIEVELPNIQKLYTDTAAYVMNLAMSDKSLADKLDEDEENGIVLIQELMLVFARQENSVEMMKREYTLSLRKVDGENKIVCDDELRALITGNFFLSKNIKQP